MGDGLPAGLADAPAEADPDADGETLGVAPAFGLTLSVGDGVAGAE